MAKEKSPAFQFYPRDFLTDENVCLMSHTERGIYMTLLCLCWLEQSLPGDVGDLARLVSVPESRFKKMWAGPLSRCFATREDGRLMQGRLEIEREKQETFRRRQSDKGKASGIARSSVPVEPRLNHGSLPVEPNVNSSISDLRSPISNLQKEQTRRAGQLIEHYRDEWYPKHRHGARLRLVGNALEFQDACSLVDTWDDARLEKLAQIVLTTDDEFISRTDRSFKIFAMKATWADDRLKQWEQEHGIQVTA